MKKLSFIILIFLFCSPLEATVNSNTRNADIIKVGPYGTVNNGTANGLGGTGCTEFHMLNYSRNFRVRQNGTIVRAAVPIESTLHMTGLYLTVWREVSSNSFNLVGTSENVLSSLVGGSIATINLASPITGVQVGDYVGCYITYDGTENNSDPNIAILGGAMGTYYYLGVPTTTAPTSTGYAWKSQLSIATSSYGWEAYMQAPNYVTIGDSIMAGGKSNTGLLDTDTGYTGTDVIKDIGGALSTLLGATSSYQNMGFSGNTTSNIVTRFTNDAVNLKPKWVLLEGGTNDLSADVPLSTMEANWLTMLQTCQNNGIIPVSLLVLPVSNAIWTNARMQVRDQLNAYITTQTPLYGGIVVDCGSLVGQFRVGGDAGNYWDLQAQYDGGDGLHPNEACYAAIAQFILNNVIDNGTITASLGGCTLRNCVIR